MNMYISGARHNKPLGQEKNPSGIIPILNLEIEFGS